MKFYQRLIKKEAFVKTIKQIGGIVAKKYPKATRVAKGALVVGGVGAAASAVGYKGRSPYERISGTHSQI